LPVIVQPFAVSVLGEFGLLIWSPSKRQRRHSRGKIAFQVPGRYILSLRIPSLRGGSRSA
jgi:hypothetical protein